MILFFLILNVLCYHTVIVMAGKFLPYMTSMY